MGQGEFDGNDPKFVNAWTEAIEYACKQLDFDLRCLDWFSHNPDFHIAKKLLKPLYLGLADGKRDIPVSQDDIAEAVRLHGIQGRRGPKEGRHGRQQA